MPAKTAPRKPAPAKPDAAHTPVWEKVYVALFGEKNEAEKHSSLRLTPDGGVELDMSEYLARSTVRAKIKQFGNTGVVCTDADVHNASTTHA